MRNATRYCPLETQCLLAVDMGLQTGLALYGRDGRLIWYRSTNFGNPARLRRGIPSILDSTPNLIHLVLEGGGPLAKIWERACERRYIDFHCISAETWRPRLLLPREQRNRSRAKLSACDFAHTVIHWSKATRPAVALRDDAAEAILIGLWGVMAVGWLEELPLELQRH